LLFCPGICVPSLLPQMNVRLIFQNPTGYGWKHWPKSFGEGTLDSIMMWLKWLVKNENFAITLFSTKSNIVALWGWCCTSCTSLVVIRKSWDNLYIW
jgi:hypothetical protein